MSEEAKWYVIHTYSGYENKVAKTIEKTVENRHLEELFQDIMIPTEKVTEIHENKDGDKTEVQVERKTYPGYVMVKMVMNDETWHVVRNVRGVTSFVGPGSKPVPLSEAEVIRLGGERCVAAAPSYQVGDIVRICEGMLEGFSGTVETVSPDSTKVKVKVIMFGREQVVELDTEQVELDA
ncbi:MAG: transcription termination/antitermination protein NusG [Clostridiales bacterium]|nr:transcription termination/antitermination protein NusG [Clostridiales bacterium]MDD7310763.1 transcription termination/antitermination protein NusG [Eubacteriales bacterium]MDY5346184.1 transcription termination/antitermination protein NusG [Eubacteriales bacterium]